MKYLRATIYIAFFTPLLLGCNRKPSEDKKDPEMKHFSGVNDKEEYIVIFDNPDDQFDDLELLDIHGGSNLGNYLFNVTNLEWSSCALAYETDYAIEFHVKTNIESFAQQIMLIYKKSNVLMYSAPRPDTDPTYKFYPVSLGSTATIFGFSKINGKIYKGQKEVVLKKDMEVSLVLEETTLEELKAAVEALEWR